MKKLILFSLLIVSSVTMTSCTTDSIADNPAAQTTINADDTGGQNNTLPPPPPKPGLGG